MLSTIILASCSVFGIERTEEATYSVILEEGDFQVREYAPALIAQTRTKGEYKASSNKSFRKLAGYIFGDNVSQEKIEMTTPVLQENKSEKIAMTVPVLVKEDNSEWEMTFVLPAQYTMETIPKPNNPDVEVKQQPSRKVATLRFSGLLNAEKMAVKTNELENWLAEKNYVAIAAPYTAAYNPPWTLPMLRRNEALIEIE